MFDLKLDPATHDLVFAQSPQGFAKFNFVQGPAQVAQAIRIHLRTWAGQWFLDNEHGVPYVREIFGKRNLQMVEAVLRSEILSVPGVDSITSFALVLDNLTRRLSVEFECSTIEGPADGQLTLNVDTGV